MYYLERHGLHHLALWVSSSGSHLSITRVGEVLKQQVLINRYYNLPYMIQICSGITSGRVLNLLYMEYVLMHVHEKNIL